MTPFFKTFLAIVISLIIFVVLADKAHAGSFKLCMADTDKKTGEVGCWTGTKSLPPKDWLKKVDPKAIFDNAEIVYTNKKASIIKVYTK